MRSVSFWAHFGENLPPAAVFAPAAANCFKSLISYAFGILRQQVFDSNDLTTAIKVKVYSDESLIQCRSKGNISRGARERRRREPLEGSGGMLPQKI